MTGGLDEAIAELLAAELPAIFGGDPPTVAVTPTSEIFTVDADSADPEASQPRTDDRTDNLPFDPNAPQGPYILTQHPDATPRKVRLRTAAGDRIPLTDGEVVFDEIDARRFTLNLRPSRDLTAVNGVQALYGITAVFTKIKYAADITLLLQGDDAAVLDRAESLGVAVLLLNLPRLITAGAESLEEGAYGVQTTVKSLKLVRGSAPPGGGRRIVLNAGFELKATRTLAEDEGKPIVRIRTTSQPLDPNRPVDIKIDIEA
jgi:hypothetical protein